ncbi:hypothetical protein EF910_16420 [Streptomyces sp. WAC07149]|uniref:DUF6292 family protein n=1 Tax=Streptomyces sp. WAC07149 TaxID=2487425 RepID=UPI000F79D765|nr:DUF6292 family protein [Streptomyces sp. WAC07149]RST04589.1 hypothetical protein EF910_16420 [Streptomyces sp. WAC07149]
MHFHIAHTPYLHAVTNALTAAGLCVLEWSAEPDDPRTGIIAVTFATPAYRGHDTALTWDEESGWHLVWGPDGHDIGYRYAAALGSSVLPTPADITNAVQQAADRHPPITASSLHRSFEDMDDGFEAELRAYAR